jgi:hypothetical protein
MELYKSVGGLSYSHIAEYGYRLVVDVDPGIVSYYRSLIPKYYDWRPQMYAAHISVVRKEIPINLDYWGKYQGEQIEFEYSGIIHRGQVYWWLNAFSVRLEEIRKELGLLVSSEYTKPPEGYLKCFHITLGNMKELS